MSQGYTFCRYRMGVQSTNIAWPFVDLSSLSCPNDYLLLPPFAKGSEQIFVQSCLMIFVSTHVTMLLHIFLTPFLPIFDNMEKIMMTWWPRSIQCRRGFKKREKWQGRATQSSHVFLIYKIYVWYNSGAHRCSPNCCAVTVQTCLAPLSSPLALSPSLGHWCKRNTLGEWCAISEKKFMSGRSLKDENHSLQFVHCGQSTTLCHPYLTPSCLGAHLEPTMSEQSGNLANLLPSRVHSPNSKQHGATFVNVNQNTRISSSISI